MLGRFNRWLPWAAVNAAYPVPVWPLEGAPEYVTVELMMSPSNELRTLKGLPSLVRMPRTKSRRSEPSVSAVDAGVALFRCSLKAALIAAQVKSVAATPAAAVSLPTTMVRGEEEGRVFSLSAALQLALPMLSAFVTASCDMGSATTSPLQLLVSKRAV